ncbi:OCIA domain-containing protein 1 [Cimex lectularius]|uniref:OCIA domain-containing protein n=1 Tax=Cimex lectularius TaxID=79782 RepID=A0A8I6TG16_CIMLE|nr:OCIA domain-containing protein 1 [Cimex lectularius]
MDQQTPFRYSKEELRVLSECNKESFYSRCLPFSTILGVTTYYAVKTGKLNPSIKFGATPKVFGAVVIGYLLGKISYQRVCVEKLMALPDSKLGSILRSKYAGKKALTMDIPESDKIIIGMKEDDKYDDVRKTSHMDIDTDRPHFANLDDTYRAPVDPFSSPELKEEPLPKYPPTTYEELRRRNREDYEKNRTKPYRGVLVPDEIPSAVKQNEIGSKADSWFDPPSKPNKKPTNIYGDSWDK